MHSRSALWVSFPLQESPASDVDIGGDACTCIIVLPWPLVSPFAKTTSHSRSIVGWSWLSCSDLQTRGFLMT